MSLSSRLVRLAGQRPHSRPKKLRRPPRFFVERLERRALLTTYTVTSTHYVGDGGPAPPQGSYDLLGAIEAANAHPNDNGAPDVIDFNIPGGGVQVIHVGNSVAQLELDVTDPVIIDATTQPGYSPGHPMIELDGSMSPSTVTLNGLVFKVGGNKVVGLDITNFEDFGLVLDGANDPNHGTGPDINNTVQDCFIGVDPSGKTSESNASGIGIYNSSYNLIGGLNPGGRLDAANAQGNLIAGNFGEDVGVYDNSNHNYIEGNYVGADVDGRNAVTAPGRLAASGAAADEIYLGPPGQETPTVFPSHNYIGDYDPGTKDFNPDGRNIIGGATVGNGLEAGYGVEIVGGADNNVVGNHIGVGYDSAQPIPNGLSGVLLEDASDNNVGGILPSEANVISANVRAGVEIRAVAVSENGDAIPLALQSPQNNFIQGNYIGTDDTGTVAVGNGSASDPNALGDGVLLRNDDSDASVAVKNNMIGGTDSIDGAQDGKFEAGNVISGNLGEGVVLVGPRVTDNEVQGNLIGLKAAGTEKLGNVGSGVLVIGEDSGAPQDNVIGDDPNEPAGDSGRNVISGNGQDGVVLSAGAANNFVLGNYIGADQTGAVTDPDGQPNSGDELGNGGDGVRIEQAPSNEIGSRDFPNIIAGNGTGGGGDGAGVAIIGSQSQFNSVQGDLIGVGSKAAGYPALANSSDGVWIGGQIVGGTDEGGPSQNVIGSTSVLGVVVNGGNVISANQGDGIHILDGANANQIAGNLIGADPNAGSKGNTGNGIEIDDSPGNTIGGSDVTPIGHTDAFRNIVVNNGTIQTVNGVLTFAAGVDIKGNASNGNKLLGNYIGVGADGTSSEGNPGGYGVFIDGAPGNVIGDGAAGDGNVISGNLQAGVHFQGAQATGNLIEGDSIGTTADGKGALGNGDGVQIAAGAALNDIGYVGVDTVIALARNVISGNNSDGVHLTSAGAHNIVQNNYIGLNAAGIGPVAGASTDSAMGVVVDNTPATIIGAATSAGGNVVSGNSGYGIIVGGKLSTGTMIEGNQIGTDANGTAAVANLLGGVDLDVVSNAQVGPSTSASVSNNTIAGNKHAGVQIELGSNGNTISGNDFSFQAAVGGAYTGNEGAAILIDSSPSNTIRNNLIADTTLPPGEDPTADGGEGIHITGTGATDNHVEKNHIEDNAGRGVFIDGGGSSNTIGGSASLGNTITENAVDGVAVSGDGTQKNVVAGNFIGIKDDGAPGGNKGATSDTRGNGVTIEDGASYNTIGGDQAGASNVISANTSFGIAIDNASHNQVEGNLIGANLSGQFQAGLGNVLAGIDVISADDNTIGGAPSAPGAAPGNKIIGNGVGIVLSTQNTFVRGNEIADSQGNADTQNAGDGIYVLQSDSVIGGAAAADANSIHDNKGAGVDVNTDSNGIAIAHNAIFNNAGLGIELHEPSDPNSNQPWANNSQAAPVISYATTGGSHRLAGWLQSAPNTTYFIEVFSGATNSYDNGDENDDAEKLVAPLPPATPEAGVSVTGTELAVTTNAGGVVFFDVTLPADIPKDAVLRATARDPVGNTSQFSNDVTVSADSDGDGVPDDEENSISGGDSQSASNVSFQDALSQNGSIGLAAPDGIAFQNAWSLPNPSPNDAPVENEFGLGFVAFTLANVPNNPLQGPAHVPITMTLPYILPEGVNYWRYGPTPGATTPHWYKWNYDAATDTGAQFEGNTIILHFVDGGLGDDDLTRNGEIVDAGGPGFSGPYTVVNTNDSGPGSLRQAILNANADPNGYDTIGFEIPGPAPHAIHLLSPLPAITEEGLTIDGFQLPPTGGGPPQDGTTPQVVLEGSQAGPAADGLTLEVDGIVVEGLVIEHFSGDGVRMESNGSVPFSQWNNSDILTGMTIESNGGYGVEINDTPYNGIGDPEGVALNAPNVISGNGSGGVYLHGVNALDNSLENNFIGVAADGVTPLGNQGPGVVIDGGARNTLIGDGEKSLGNTIAYNAGPGVEALNASGSGVYADSIFSNTGLGIDLGGDGVTPNVSQGLENFPVLASASSYGGETFVSGTLSSAPNTNFTIDLYASAAADPSGYGQGRMFLYEASVRTDGNRQASFDATINAPVPSGWFITATATTRGANTSEFSAALALSSAAPAVYIVNTPDDVEDPNPDPAHFSLREAIEAANQHPGQDVIQFALPDQTRTISPTSPLPDITDPAVIDGASQFGYQGLPLVELSGSAAPAGSMGLHITGGGSVIRGLAVNGFAGGELVLEGGSGNLVEGDYLGTDVTGTRAVPGSATSVHTGASLEVNNSSGNLIGGTTAAARNLITSLSIASESSTGNRIEGNYVGVDVTGTVDLRDSSYFQYEDNNQLLYAGVIGAEVGGEHNIVGGADPGAGNLIANGVQLGGNFNAVQGNLIGVDPTGKRNLGGGIGVLVGRVGQEQGSVIGGATRAARNIIANGLWIGSDVVDSQVEGNYIGADVTGAIALGSSGFLGADVLIDGQNNTIGGAGPGEGNLISGAVNHDSNTGYGEGVDLAYGSHDNQILGNRIGVDATGTKALGNDGSGVISFGHDNKIGGPLPGEGNLISGNGADGIELAGIGSDAVVGNLIGVDVTGAVALPNRGQNHGYLGNFAADWGVGIYVAEQNVTIGGSTPGARNIISGNASDGIRVLLTGYNPAIGISRDSIVVQGNYIGTDVTGTQPLGNGGDGIFIGASTTDTIGGPLGGMGNVIAANGGDGIRVVGRQDAYFDYSTGTPGPNGEGMIVQGNKVGTDVTGTRQLGNTGDGISVTVSYGIASDEQIGGTTPGAGNLVAYNGGRGVYVPFGNGNVIEANDVFANGGPALISDIADALSNYAEQRGVDAPHAAPVLTSAVFSPQGTVVTGSLTGMPFTSSTIDFFANDTVRAGGLSDAQSYLESITLFLGSSGTASFQLPLDAAVPVGQWITATATSDLTTNHSTAPGSPVAAPYPNTSELSQPVPVVAAADASDIQFSAPTYLVTENGASAVVTVTRTGSTAGTATVDYATNDGTALAGSNYTATAGTLTFNDGEATKTITIPIQDDGVAAGDKAFQIVLSNAAGAVVGGVPSATVTIADSDRAGEIQFAASASTDDRYLDGGAVFDVTRTGGSLGRVTVDYRVTGGTAIAGASSGPVNPNDYDYLDSFGTLTFDEGQTTAEIFVKFTVQFGTATVAPTHFGPRTIEMTLGNPTGGATLGDLTTSTVTVDDPEDQNGAFSVHSDDTSVKESAGKVGFIVNRDGNLTTAETVDYATIDGTAKAGTNYVAVSGTLTFQPGQDRAVVWVTVLDDGVVDVPGDFQFAISNPTGGAFIFAGGDSVDMPIVDSDAPQPGSLGIRQQVNGDFSGYQEALVAENAGSVTITVVRTGGSDGTVTVQYVTSDGNFSGGGNAKAGVDYAATSGTLTFGPGQTTQTFSVPVFPDDAVLSDKTFFVTLSDPTGGATLGGSPNVTPDGQPLPYPNPAPVVILPPALHHTVNFIAPSYEVAEASDEITVPLPAFAGAVDYTTVDGTAQAGVRYTTVSGTLSPSQGWTITVPLLNNAPVDGNQTFYLKLSNPTGGAVLGANRLIPITVLDEDAPATTTKLTSDAPGGATYGQSVTFTAALSADNGTPTGTVDFVDTTTGQDLGSSTLAVVGGVDVASVNVAGLTAGSHAIVATYTSDAPGFINSNDSLVQTIAPAMLTVAADDKSKNAGSPNPPLTYTISGFVNGDTASVVGGALGLSTTAGPASGAGDYPISVFPIMAASGALRAANYAFSFVDGTLSVALSAMATATKLTSDAASGSTYGQSVTFTAVVSAGSRTPTGDVDFVDTTTGQDLGSAALALVGGVDEASVSVAGLAAGSHAIVANYASDAGDFTDSNDSLTQSVAKASLNVRADDKTKVYGSDNPLLTATITGFANSDTPSVVSGAAELTTNATAASGVGAYPITVALGTLSADNYTFDLAAGALTITPATLTVTADNKSKVYGAANPPLTAAITGFVNSDAASVVSGAADLSTSATQASGAGDYPIVVTRGTLSAANYVFAFVNGTLSVTLAGQGGDAIIATALPLEANEFGDGRPFTAATFTFGDGSLAAGDFSAKIDWGDGVTSSGDISMTAGTYTVSGSHAYLDEGRFTIRVEIEQTAGPNSGGATAVAVSSTATMHEQLLAEGTQGTPTQKYVQEIYRDLFDRQAEPQGRDFWGGLLNAGVPRSAVDHGIVAEALSEEFQYDTVNALYQKYLHRAPDSSGQKFWTTYLYSAGGTIEGMSISLIGSAEYFQTRGGGAASGFLRALYHDLLGRDADSEGLSYFTNLMAGGSTTSDIAAMVFGSAEYHRVLVDSLYEKLLDRPADPEGLAFFAAELAAGATEESIIVQMLSSDEYFAKPQL